MDFSFTENCVATGLILIVALFLFLISNKRKHLRSLHGKHVVITGASCGIGFALAKECLSQGASVSLIARNASHLARAARALSSTCATLVPSPRDRILLKAVDVSDAIAVSAAIVECFEWKPIDILICNAGRNGAGLIDQVKVKELETTVKTNILGSVYPVHAALPLMKTRSKQHPCSIVFMSSLSGLVFVSGMNVYAMTKHALKGLAEMLRFELRPYNIRVSLVCAGFTETAMLDEVDKAERINFNIASKLLFYKRSRAETASEVAEMTMEGVKRGEFLITTRILGFMIGVLGRGFVPADSLARVLIELLLFAPVRIASCIWFAYAKQVLRRVPIPTAPQPTPVTSAMDTCTDLPQQKN